MTCEGDSDNKSFCTANNRKDGAFFDPNPKILSSLNSKRTKSSIPSRDSQWLYPSQQQFYRSTLNKGHNVDSKLIPAIVEIHNLVNEKAWERVMEYESLHNSECKNPVLVHFVGKKDKPTIKSIINRFIGYKSPYDRHDWTVDRCGKRIRFVLLEYNNCFRYILDFYEGSTDNPNKFGVYIDVRPDLSFNGICDRIRFFLNKSLPFT